MALFHSLWTIVLLVLFIGIIAWAWGTGRRERFERAARMPLEEDEPVPQERENS